MVMVDITVPSIGREYNFSLDEQTPIAALIAEIVEVICQKESCRLDGGEKTLTLCSMEEKLIMSQEASLSQYGVENGCHLLLV